jgi:hypothetical protein
MLFGTRLDGPEHYVYQSAGVAPGTWTTRELSNREESDYDGLGGLIQRGLRSSSSVNVGTVSRGLRFDRRACLFVRGCVSIPGLDEQLVPWEVTSPIHVSRRSVSLRPSALLSSMKRGIHVALSAERNFHHYQEALTSMTMNFTKLSVLAATAIMGTLAGGCAGAGDDGTAGVGADLSASQKSPNNATNTPSTVPLTCTNSKDSSDVVTATISHSGAQLAWGDYGTSPRTSNKAAESDYGTWSGQPDLNPTVKLPSVLVSGSAGQVTVQFSGDGAPSPSHYQCTPGASKSSAAPTAPASGTCNDTGQRCESRAKCEGGDGAVVEDVKCPGPQVCCSTS